jgi:hypothetical protein
MRKGFNPDPKQMENSKLMIVGERVMKKWVFNAIIVLLGCMIGASLLLAAQVDQGKCIAYDEQKQLLTIEEYDLNFSAEHKYGKPTGKHAVYNLRDAKIGVPPAVGDVMRLSYELKGNERFAIKVMNVSKQDVMKK